MGQPGAATGSSQPAVTASSKLSPLRWLTSGNPTNYNMLLFRTLNRCACNRAVACRFHRPRLMYQQQTVTHTSCSSGPLSGGLFASMSGREMDQPNANADNLAPLLRDKLMPVRMWWMKNGPGAMSQFRRALEHKRLGVPGVVNFVDARTKWFDQAVDQAVGQHGIKQVVVVAAGFDTRAYRFGAKYPGVKFFEIDLPHASSKKQQLVQQLLQPEASYPRPTYIPADLSRVALDQALLDFGQSQTDGETSGLTGASGFDPNQPTLFTVEGLIYYLPEAAVRELFAALLRVAAPGSRMAFDFLHKKVLEGAVPLPPAYKVTAQSVANKDEPFISGIDNSREAVAAFMTSVTDSSSAAAAPTGAGQGAAAAAAAGERKQKRFQVLEYLGPKEMLSQQLPHLQWDNKVPPILSFYSFAAVEVS